MDTLIHSYPKYNKNLNYVRIGIFLIMQKLGKIIGGIILSVILRGGCHGSLPMSVRGIACCSADSYWGNVTADLTAYAQHAGRVTITVDDMELLLKRSAIGAFLCPCPTTYVN